MTESGRTMRHRIAQVVFITGMILALLSFRVGLPPVPLFVIAFPSWLLLFATPGYPELTEFEYFVVFSFASWLNGHLLGWLIWRFATIHKRIMTQPEVGQVSSESAPSAESDEPST